MREKKGESTGGAAVAGTEGATEYRKTALAAARVLGLRVAGIDMIESDEGPMVLEVNSSPGLEGIEKTTGVDVTEAVIEQVEHDVQPTARSVQVGS